ncbi:MAG: hypothetical protein ABR921_05735 [Candidatus Sulfotelmatobacter sp.]|jgi:hypothetical protein
MSAPAPALAAPAKTPRKIAVVRMADASGAVAILSLVFGLLLVFFPESFPRMIVRSWQHAQLMPIMMVFTFLLDTCLYLRVAYLQSAKPRPAAAACLGSLPILVVGGLSILLRSALSHTLAAGMPNLQARLAEEILAHTYLGLVSAVFLPFLAIRLLQQLKAANA